MAHPLGHFKTITKHRHKVIRNCFKAGIFWQGLRHDLSKYSPTEFIPGAKFYLKTKKVEPVEMPKRYLAEMFCDRVAASKTYNGKNYTNHHPLDYFLKGQARYHMHPQTAKDLEIMLRLLADKGEDEAFAYVKRMVKNDK